MKTFYNVIFLDVDGVLNSEVWNEKHQREIQDGLLIDSVKVKLLGELVRQTEARLVLHSGWRFWFDKNLQPVKSEAEYLWELLQKEQMEIYSVTPDFSTEEIRKTKRFSLVKAGEIRAWLEEHREVKSWIVLDDLDLNDEEIKRRQIRTNNKTGLTKEDVEKAMRLALYGI